MLDKNGNRMLAYVQQISDIQPIKGADNIELAHVLGWDVIIKKGEFKEGDKCVFFEIDSKLPADNPAFAFLQNKGYKVKTYKLNKFGVIGQGLAMPLDILGIGPDIELNIDLTSRLKVTYALEEDNVRKCDVRNDAINSYKKKHKKFFNNKVIVFLMKSKFFEKLFLVNAGKVKKDYKKVFPINYVEKTDEERVQNIPYILKDKTPLIATEKIDGTSTTWLLVRKPFGRFEFYVCSRNVRFYTEDKKDVYMNQDNIYWENAKKYDVENQMKKYLEDHKDLKWVCIQGESYGEGWQGNPLQMKGHHFAAFNFKDSKNGRWGSAEGKKLLASWDTPIPWVPILDENFVLPDTVDELLKIATDKSTINPNVLREGIVFRGKDGKESFKAVSPEYLMKHHI